MTYAAYSDTCEGCLSERTRIVVRPAMALPDGDGGLIAAYRCPGCGHAWTCGWGIQAGPLPPPPPSDPMGLEDLTARTVIRVAARHRPPAV